MARRLGTERNASGHVLDHMDDRPDPEPAPEDEAPTGRKRSSGRVRAKTAGYAKEDLAAWEASEPLDTEAESLMLDDLLDTHDDEALDELLNTSPILTAAAEEARVERTKRLPSRRSAHRRRIIKQMRSARLDSR